MKGRELRITRWGGRYLGRRFPCAVGKGGITTKKTEGDGATPAGIYQFAEFSVFTRADRIRPLGGERIGPQLIWSDDPTDPWYNAPVRHARPGSYPYSCEQMWRSDHLYDLVIDIGYNGAPAIPGNGSAIFIHQWRKPRHPTEGCIAMAPHVLKWIVANYHPMDRLVVRP